MSQASDELRDQMKQWFGDPVDDGGPIEFLKSHGFTLTSDWCWKLPTSYHHVSCYEWLCIQFLCYEWDFGAIMDDNDRDTICLCGQGWKG